jgi:hypothetical protein
VRVTFVLDHDDPVSVVGDFNGWDSHADPLRRQPSGQRSATVLLGPGRYAFRYLGDGGRFFDDPEADAHEANGHGDLHSVLEVPAPTEPAPTEPAPKPAAKAAKKPPAKAQQPAAKKAPAKAKQPAAKKPAAKRASTAGDPAEGVDPDAPAHTLVAEQAPAVEPNEPG